MDTETIYRIYSDMSDVLNYMSSPVVPYEPDSAKMKDDLIQRLISGAIEVKHNLDQLYLIINPTTPDERIGEE